MYSDINAECIDKKFTHCVIIYRCVRRSRGIELDESVRVMPIESQMTWLPNSSQYQVLLHLPPICCNFKRQNFKRQNWTTPHFFTVRPKVRVENGSNRNLDSIFLLDFRTRHGLILHRFGAMPICYRRTDTAFVGAWRFAQESQLVDWHSCFVTKTDTTFVLYVVQ